MPIILSCAIPAINENEAETMLKLKRANNIVAIDENIYALKFRLLLDNPQKYIFFNLKKILDFVYNNLITYCAKLSQESLPAPCHPAFLPSVCPTKIIDIAV